MRAIVTNRCHAIAACALLWTCFVAAPAHADVDAITVAKEDRRIGFTVSGQVAEVAVKEGDFVSQGDVLIRLRDEDIKVAIEVHRLNAESDIELRAADEEVELTRIEMQRTEQLFDQDAAGEFQLLRARVQHSIARLRAEMARKERDVSRAEYDRSQILHSYYQMKAPMDGIVERLLVREGETVEQLNPVLRLVVVDPLLVHAHPPIAQTLSLRTGSPAWITIHLDGYQHKPIEGTITNINALADSASGSRRVTIELPNPDQIPPGVKVTVSFTKPDSLASSALDGN